MSVSPLRDNSWGTTKKRNSMILGYARSSTTRQDLSTQKKVLKEHGATQIYTEQKSGASNDRPVFRQLVEEAISAAEHGEDVEVVVMRLDRFGRSLPEVVSTLTKFSEAGVKFKSLNEVGITLDGTPSSLLVLTVLAAAASYERSTTQARIKEARAATGRVGGRPRVMTHKTVARAKSLVDADGLSLRQTAGTLGVSVRTLRRYLEA